MTRYTIATALASLLVLACEAPARTGAREPASSPNLPPAERDAKDPARSPEIEPGISRPAPRTPGAAPDASKPPAAKIPGSAPDGSSHDAPREPGSSAPRPPGDR